MRGGGRNSGRGAVGRRGGVGQVEGGDEISLRLRDMGLVPGTECTLLGAALLGDPLELEVRGYRLSLRKGEAARVEVIQA